MKGLRETGYPMATKTETAGTLAALDLNRSQVHAETAMPISEHVIFVCDESGAKGYADRDEASPGEVGVFAGILIPSSLLDAAQVAFQAIYDRYKPAQGKFHIADLPPDSQEALRQDVYSAIRDLELPCFWYAIHVAGFHQWHVQQAGMSQQIREGVDLHRPQPPRYKGGSPREHAASLHVSLFEGLHGQLVGFLGERDRIDTIVDIRTDRIDASILADFERGANSLLNDSPTVKAVKAWDTQEQKVVTGAIQVAIDYSEDMQFSKYIKSMTLTVAEFDVCVLAADVLANSLNYHFMQRDDEERYRPLNDLAAVSKHPLARNLDTFHDWGDGELVGDRLYAHPKHI